MSTLYDVLGVCPTAEGGAIQRAFRDLAKAHHPDQNVTDGDIDERFKQITAAYAILKNATTRAAYDARLEQARRLTRRRQNRDLLICGVAAVLSFGAMSGGILLYRDARAAQQFALQEPPSTQTGQASPPVLADRPRKFPALEAYVAAIEESPARAATGMTELRVAAAPGASAPMRPTEGARDRAEPPAADLKSLKPAEQAPTIDVRVWTLARSVGRASYAVKMFTVPRERGDDRPPVSWAPNSGRPDSVKTVDVLFRASRRRHRTDSALPDSDALSTALREWQAARAPAGSGGTIDRANTLSLVPKTE
jgi:DnaJ-domain-containing protein 1